jgi:hypothetical protein
MIRTRRATPAISGDMFSGATDAGARVDAEIMREDKDEIMF